jgi:2-methylaconitate cis-trans-isomerase PrpF
VPGTGAKITMDWADTVGAMTGKLLPTRNVKDIFTVDGREYPVSLVDAGNPLVFISAGSLGMKGTESPAQIEGDAQLMALIEKLRSQAAVIFGLVSRAEDAAKLSPYNPFFAIISKPADFTTLNGKAMKAADMDVTSRLLFMLRMHKAYPISGTVCTGAAARIPGSVVWDALSPKARENGTLRIGHPSGVVLVEAYAHNENGAPRFDKLGIYRTARRIMDGIVYVKNEVFEKGE